MNIVGVHYGHNATVALVQNGKLVFAMSEERFNRLKNSNGMPVQTLEYIYTHYVKPEEVDCAVMFQSDVVGYLEMKRHGFKSVRNFGVGNMHFNRRYSFKNHLLSKFGFYHRLRSFAGNIRRSLRERALKDEMMSYYATSLRLPKEKILLSQHHASHAYACCFNLPRNEKTLIFTMDGEGDYESSTVSIWDGTSMQKLSSNPVQVSLGYFFTEITKLLGMTPNEHEFKVMGLAPYAKQERARKLYEQHKDLLWLDEHLQFQSSKDMRRLEYYLLEKLYGQRFDTIAAFAQIFLEEKVLEWVSKWVEKTGIHNLALGGGVFMSVKLNQKILELPGVEKLFVMPSGADESTAIGAAFYGSRHIDSSVDIQPIEDLYLGNEYSNEEIEKHLRSSGSFEKYSVQKFSTEIELAQKVAELLSQNKVVARFAGRTEWGARALGNRSILANPSSRDTVRVINEMIKNRDFWMPFASSILEEDASRYLKIKKPMPAPYMAITFDTTELAQTHIQAAIHPYDFTCRPQLVSKNWNPSYHALISKFKELTGIGAVLNTSLNLHGEPNVESPKDALHTLEDSGLEHLAIGNFLVSKK